MTNRESGSTKILEWDYENEIISIQVVEDIRLSIAEGEEDIGRIYQLLIHGKSDTST